MPERANTLVRRSPVESGAWSEGTAYLKLGAGPPLVLLPGLTAHHGVPRGADRGAAVGAVRRLARGRQVWWVNRRAGLTPGATMADLAQDLVPGLRARFDAAVDVVGMSTGGSTALQLAADHPGLLRRLVLVCAACRLGPHGRAGQRELAAALESGDRRRAGAAVLGGIGSPAAEPFWRAVGRLLGPSMFRHDPTDLLVTLAAEDGFDLTARLARITTPVLVIGGDRDRPYGPALMAETVSRLPRGRLLLYPRTSHLAVPGRRRFAADVLRFLDAP